MGPACGGIVVLAEIKEKLALHLGQPLASGNCCSMRQVNMALRHISAWRRRRQILGTFAMSEPQGLVALPLDPGSYLANTSSLTLALV